ncbi:AraC family transcriptional regulator [Pseudonocardia kujensis]|uniref:AraC family transcriptional regulator n=1 Tax=Pseudonocardia kujensis TaxID=1128675 RepID=UPI001E3E00CC|nr:AraC family transcriptional regulator [Pseudonocardia kujensis]MCE0768093.1 AraC family transcriptional regulator [Pseudonocardia kujensis]
MGPVVRAASLRGLPALVDALGGDPDALLARFGVTREAVSSDDAVIGVRSAGLLLETAAAELGRPDLGLLLAERQDAGVLGPLAVAIENARTLGEALASASRFLFVHSPALSIAQVADPEEVRGVLAVRYGAADPSGATQPLPAQAADLGLGLLHRIILLLHGGPYGLRSAHLAHPPLVPVTRYTDFFGADVRFARPAAVLRLPAALTAAPVAGGDRLLRTLALDYLESHFAEPGQTVAGRVRGALARSLGSAPPQVGDVARLLRLHPRTLQRHLAAEGTTFERVLDEVRRDAAHRLITTTDLPFGQVTAMLGLAAQSGLTRAVRRWFGTTPTGLRAGPTGTHG